jgi:hypothetical protein
MKKVLIAAAAVAGLLSAGPASAQKMTADDMKWVNQCIDDNKNEPGATPAIVRAYCVCMNEKMDDNETRSITQWEKANPAARRACDRQAGWR